MGFLWDVIRDAVATLGDFGPELREVLGLTVVVSGAATIIGVACGVPVGLGLGLGRFRGRRAALTVINTGMGIPPVLAGLVLLIFLWDDGPLGGLEVLFTPWAMVAAQAILAFPIAAGVTAAAVANLGFDAREHIAALGLSRSTSAVVAAREVWPGIIGATAAAFGRVVSEVGAVLIVGGNIRGETRVLTTAVVEEARQARFGAAVGLGVLLLLLALIVSAVLTATQLRSADG